MFLYASLISDVCYTSNHLEQHVTVALHKNFASLPREQFTEIPKQQLLRWKNSLQKRKNVLFPYHYAKTQAESMFRTLEA